MSDEIKAIVNKAIKCLEKIESVYPWLHKPGDIIQCSPSALREGDFYVMGFNPGASNLEQNGSATDPKSLRQTIEEIPSLTKSHVHPLSGWKRGWENFASLAQTLQPNHWEQDLFVTNLFPDQSTGIQNWLADHKKRPVSEYVSAIWQLHKILLATVRPRVIIVHGQGARHSAFRYLWENLKKSVNKDAKWNQTMSDTTWNRDPSIKYFDVNKLSLDDGDELTDLMFIGIRHLRLPQQSDMQAVKALIGSKD